MVEENIIGFYGLAEMPFNITADPRYLWYSPRHTEAKFKITHHIQSKKGPIFLSADVGTGKTSIAKRIAQEMEGDTSKQVVFVFAPNIKTTNAFLRFIMEEFQVKTDRNYARSLKNFEQFLIDQFKANRSPVLLIDEAQNMTLDMLKLIHHLFNFTTDKKFLIQMALFGQEELKDKIARYASLKSRMTPARLEPFTLDETQQMIDYRWKVAGGKKQPFDVDALAEVFRYTGGNPRAICQLCDKSLIKAYVDQRHAIDRDTVSAAVTDAFIFEVKE